MLNMGHIICDCYQFFSAIVNKNIEQQCVIISHQIKLLDYKNLLYLSIFPLASLFDYTFTYYRYMHPKVSQCC